MTDQDRPKPGSRAARDLNCTCPVLDNNHGRRAPWPPDNWYITEGCPVHYGDSPAEVLEEEEEE